MNISSWFENINAPSERISPHYAVLNYRGKRMFRDHQTQIKKIVYFPAEFFLGMTVKRKLFFFFRCLRLLSAILTLTPVLLMLVATKIFVSLMGVIILALILRPINVSKFWSWRFEKKLNVKFLLVVQFNEMRDSLAFFLFRLQQQHKLKSKPRQFILQFWKL